MFADKSRKEKRTSALRDEFLKELKKNIAVDKIKTNEAALRSKLTKKLKSGELF